MKRVFGKNTHAPDAGTFGDCLQACIASMLDMSLEEVPHFMRDGCSGEEGFRRVNEFLSPKGFAAVVMHVEPSQRFGVPVCHLLGGLNPAGEHHVVIACDMEPIHNPALIENDFIDASQWVKPCEGFYEVWLIVLTSRPASFAQQLLVKKEEATVG